MPDGFHQVMLRRSETEQATKKRLRQVLGIGNHVPIVVVTTMILAPGEPFVSCRRVRCFSTSSPPPLPINIPHQGREKIRSGKQASKQSGRQIPTRLCATTTTTSPQPREPQQTALALSRDPRSSIMQAICRQVGTDGRDIFLPFPFLLFSMRRQPRQRNTRGWARKIVRRSSPRA